MREVIRTSIVEGEDHTFVAQPKLGNMELIILQDVDNWSLRITQVGAAATDVYELLNQTPVIANFELSTAAVTGTTHDHSASTFTRASGSWLDDLYFVGATFTPSGWSGANLNGNTFTVTAVTDTVLTYTAAVGATETGGTITLTSDEFGARSTERLINDKLWTFGGVTPGHSFKYVLDWSLLSPPLIGGKKHQFEWEFDCRTAGFGKRYLVAVVDVEPLHSV